jgi:long-subunit fatty acid transport protein
VAGTAERDRVQSEAFDEARSFDIRTLRVRPSVSYQPGRTLDVTLSGVYAQKRDRAKGRQADLLKFPVELTWRRAGRLRLTANAELAQVDLSGAAIGLAQFELTDGRGPGTSFLWGLQGRYALTDNLRATLNYDGRAPATADPIHTVRVQVSASF